MVCRTLPGSSSEIRTRRISLSAGMPNGTTGSADRIRRSTSVGVRTSSALDAPGVGAWRWASNGSRGSGAGSAGLSKASLSLCSSIFGSPWASPGGSDSSCSFLSGSSSGSVPPPAAGMERLLGSGVAIRSCLSSSASAPTRSAIRVATSGSCGRPVSVYASSAWSGMVCRRENTSRIIPCILRSAVRRSAELSRVWQPMLKHVSMSSHTLSSPSISTNGFPSPLASSSSRTARPRTSAYITSRIASSTTSSFPASDGSKRQ